MLVIGLIALRYQVSNNVYMLMPEDLVLFNEKPEPISEETLWEDNPIDTVDIPNCTEIRKIMFWRNPSGQKEMIKYYICAEDVLTSMKVRSSGKFLDDLYSDMYLHDKHFLGSLISAYKDKIQEDNLNSLDGARLVVRSVQSIPYTLVHCHTHSEAEEGLPHRVKYHNRARAKYGKYIDRIGGCLESIDDGGVVSPLEFASHHMGDCDSRTVFLYTILKELGYDVVVLGSYIERHSILGINIGLDRPRDDFFLLNGTKKFYVWETTSLGFDLGMYPDWDQEKWTIDLN